MTRSSILPLVAGVLMLLTVACAQNASDPTVANGAATNGNAVDRKAGGQPVIADVKHAIAVLQPVGDSGVEGVIRFTREGEAVRISGTISGLTPGKHGFHIHEFGDTSDVQTGKSAGGHFNPTGEEHGRPDDPRRHVGDLGNIEADDSGEATISMEDKVIRLNGPHAILGRAIVVHEKEDQFTQPSGDAGDRVAFGVIGVANPKKPIK